MNSVSGKELCSLLEKNGWKLARISGSHHIYLKEGRIERISVPVHGNRDLKIGLLKHLIEMANLEWK